MNGILKIDLDSYNSLICTLIENSKAKEDLENLQMTLASYVYAALEKELKSDYPVITYTSIKTDELCELCGLDYKQLKKEWQNNRQAFEEERKEQEVNAYTD